MRVKICFVFLLSFTLTSQVALKADDWDSAGWSSCEELSGEFIEDCSMIGCEREEIGEDPVTGEPIFGDQECPTFAGLPPAGTTALAGDVRVKISGSGGYEGYYSSWTSGTTVICARDYLCEGCTPPQGIEFTTDCMVTSTSNPQLFTDTVGVTECDPYEGEYLELER